MVQLIILLTCPLVQCSKDMEYHLYLTTSPLYWDQQCQRLQLGHNLKPDKPANALVKNKCTVWLYVLILTHNKTSHMDSAAVVLSIVRLTRVVGVGIVIRILKASKPAMHQVLYNYIYTDNFCCVDCTVKPIYKES